jgi:hypothetical protein
VPPVHSDGFGSTTVKDCRLDPEAEAIFNSERIKEGKRSYTSEDLRSDIGSFIHRFIIKGGLGLKTVEGETLVRGIIGASHHRDEIVQVLKPLLLEEHRLSNSSTGYNVRPDAVEAVKFYSANNVFTGPLREAFDKLKDKLRLE